MGVVIAFLGSDSGDGVIEPIVNSGEEKVVGGGVSSRDARSVVRKICPIDQPLETKYALEESTFGAGPSCRPSWVQHSDHVGHGVEHLNMGVWCDTPAKDCQEIIQALCTLPPDADSQATRALIAPL